MKHAISLQNKIYLSMDIVQLIGQVYDTIDDEQDGIRFKDLATIRESKVTVIREKDHCVHTVHSSEGYVKFRIAVVPNSFGDFEKNSMAIVVTDGIIFASCEFDPYSSIRAYKTNIPGHAEFANIACSLINDVAEFVRKKAKEQDRTSACLKRQLVYNFTKKFFPEYVSHAEKSSESANPPTTTPKENL